MFFARLKRRNRMERDRARAAMLRAGLVAAEIRNTLRSKQTDRVWTAYDFVKGDEEETGIPDKSVVKAQHAALRASFARIAAQRRTEG